MRVLHCYKTSLNASMGGVEVFLDTLCNHEASLGVESTLFALNKQPSSTPVQMKHHRIIESKQLCHFASTGFSVSAFSDFKRCVAEADIVHYHFPNPFADMLHFACQVSKPTIMTYHSDIIKQKRLLQLYNPLMHRFLSAMDIIVSTSNNYVATSKILPRYKDKIEVIPACLDATTLPPLNQERLAYWQARLPQPFFLFIGAFRYYKGLTYAIEAVADTPFQLVLAGSGGVEADLKKQVQDNRQDNVHFVGQISEEDKVALHHLSHAFVFPSHQRTEAFGLALIEAAILGKPMISCEIGTATSFVNSDGETGIVIPPASPEAIREAMQGLIKHPEKAKTYGEQAKKRYLALLTPEKQAKAYVALYEQLGMT